MLQYVVFDLLGVLTPVDETKREILEELRAKNLKLAAISNLQPARAKEIASYYGLDDLYLAQELSLSKVSPEIYKRFLLDHQVSAADCLFIEDHLDNLLAAKKVGLKTIFLGGKISAGVDYTITSLAEISEIIAKGI